MRRPNFNSSSLLWHVRILFTFIFHDTCVYVSRSDHIVRIHKPPDCNKKYWFIYYKADFCDLVLRVGTKKDRCTFIWSVPVRSYTTGVLLDKGESKCKSTSFSSAPTQREEDAFRFYLTTNTPDSTHLMLSTVQQLHIQYIIHLLHSTYTHTQPCVSEEMPLEEISSRWMKENYTE